MSYLVQPGDTLSAIASSHSATLAAVELANPQIHDPNLIYAGQMIKLPETHGQHVVHAPQSVPTHHSAPAHSAPVHAAPAHQAAATRHTAPAHQAAATHHAAPVKVKVKTPAPARAAASYSAGSSATSLADIPGVPHSFAACVAFRESTDLQNPAANGNAYGIISSSGYNVSGTSVAHQKQVFAELYHQYGGKPWAADGCPGT
jgi:LysM repeat protein